MAAMKLCSVLLLCMLTMRQCIPCEASRKMLMAVDAEGNGALLLVSRRILLEEGEEANNMEVELMLPDETDSEQLDIEQQEPLEKLKKKKKHKEDELMLTENGDGDLPSEGGQNENPAGEKAQKKKKKKIAQEGKIKVSVEHERIGQSTTGENLQEEVEVEEKKVRNDIEEISSTDKTLEGDPFLEMGKEADAIEGLSREASQPDDTETDVEIGGGASLSEGGGEVGGNTFEEKETEEQQATLDDTKQYKEEGKTGKSLKPKKSKKEEIERAVKEKTSKTDTDEVLKSKVQDDKAVKGKAEAEEITDEVTPADVIEREMQGGVEDSVTQAVGEAKVVEGKQQSKEEVGTMQTKDQGSSDESKQTEGGKAKKKSSKKPKTSKQSKSEVQVSEDEDAESKSSKSIETEVKQKKNELADLTSPLELQGDSGVEAPDTSELQVKQSETQDKAKPKTKKKKAKSSEKSKTEEKPFKKKEKDELLSEEAKEEAKDSKLAEAKGDKKISKSEILNELDIDANGEEDTSAKKQSQVEKPSKQMEDELLSLEKQEEKLDVEVQSIAKEAQERAEEAMSTTESVSSSAQGVDEDDDEYGDFLQDFTDFSTKFQDTALKVADHLGPNIQKFTDTSKVYFNKANQHIEESFSPLVGKQFAPFLASLVSYGLLLVPLAVVILLFEHIRALLSLQKVLLFVNIYLAAYFATLLLATFIMGEPMNYFYKSSASGYVHLQLLQALAYIVYLILQTFDLVFTCTSETVPVKVTVALQWLVAFTVGFHYYVTIFHRAMTLKGPHTNWKIYGIYSIAFLVLCLFARIKRVKKGYSQIGQADTDKKH